MKSAKLVVGITGGTSGIGRDIAALFLAKGHFVAVCSRSPQALRSNSRCLLQAADVRRRADVHHFVDAIKRRWRRLDVFVNCAGVSLWKPIADISEPFLRGIIDTNVLGTLWGCQASASLMRRGSSIINLSSLAGKRGSTNNSAYSASKFAVNGITQSLAKELGPKGIRVNAVCPVYVKTPYILSSLKAEDSPAAGENVQRYLSQFARTQTALGRLPQGKEVAQLVYFLASPEASAITGQCINVDCGTLPQ